MSTHHVPRILVVDDSLDIQWLLRIFLESKGYAVECTSNGAEAISHLESLNELPDVILLDLRMPVMDGFGFLALQREIPRIRDIPTVVMTGDDDNESMRLKTQPTVEGKYPDLLVKPLSVKSVINAIERNYHLH